MFVTKIKMVALLVLIVGLFAAGGLFTRHALTAASQPEDARDKPIVSCVLPKPGGLQRMASFNGHVRAAAQQQVYPVVSGHVKRIAVDIGDRVKQGDVLAEIEAPLLAAEVKQATSALEMAQAQEQEATARIDTAEAEVEAAKVLLKVRIGDSEVATAEKTKWQSEVNRLTREVERNVIAPQVLKESQNQLALAKAKGKAGEAAVAAAESDIKIKQCKLSQARAARQAASAAAASAHAVLDKARIQESFTQLKATLDGVVMSRNINTGDFVSASDQGGRQPLMIVLRTDPMRVVVDVPESEIPFIRAGAAVHLRINALPEVKLPDCKVSRTGFAIDEKTGTMPVEIDVPNPKLVLRPGLFITASIHLDKKAPAGAVLVPASSVVKRKGRSCVYLVRDGEAHLTPIQVSWSSGDNVEIESGVRASDRLVVNPRGLEGEVVPVEVKKAP